MDNPFKAVIASEGPCIELTGDRLSGQAEKALLP